ncbi:uncharacterized protein LOC119553399 isoform X6 [Drosophila subpulchrella]|uniref:uncharacterized protein LOC119553399 isoform X6 n=1 Tax=Drosophila subpulchrella TaxID=1486046 RepID=UPI0018A166ED|nr:uncharacterized protein LOC119553399 isoform X6 [Drosophila subpulchrella]
MDCGLSDSGTGNIFDVRACGSNLDSRHVSLLLHLHTWNSRSPGHWMSSFVYVILNYYQMDLTQFIAPLFIMSFVLVIFSAYFLMTHIFLPDIKDFAYMFFEILLTVVMLSMATLHAQTINGDRHVQMSMDDFILAALLLFHEFLAIYALTFYWQINYNYFTSSDFFWMSTSTQDTHGTTAMNRDYEDYDDKPNEEEWKVTNITSYDWGADDWEISNGRK